MSVKGEQSLQQIVFVKPDVHVLRVKPHCTQTATPVSRVNPETITLLEENVVLTSLIYIYICRTHTQIKVGQYQIKVISRSWRDGSLGSMFAAQVWGPEFRTKHPGKKAGPGHAPACYSSAVWDEDRRSLGNCWCQPRSRYRQRLCLKGGRQRTLEIFLWPLLICTGTYMYPHIHITHTLTQREEALSMKETANRMKSNLEQKRKYSPTMSLINS